MRETSPAEVSVTVTVDVLSANQQQVDGSYPPPRLDSVHAASDKALALADDSCEAVTIYPENLREHSEVLAQLTPKPDWLTDYVRPSFDPEAFAAEERAEEEQARTEEFPLYARRACRHLEKSAGKRGLAKALFELDHREFGEAQEVLDLARTTECPHLAAADGRLDQLEKYIRESRILFDD